MNVTMHPAVSPGHVCLLQVPTASASPLRHSFGSTVPRKALCRVHGEIRSVKFLDNGTRSKLPYVFTRRRVAGFDLGGNLGKHCVANVGGNEFEWAEHLLKHYQLINPIHNFYYKGKL